MRDKGGGMRDEGVTDVSSPLSVPSHPRSFGRPLFSLCPGRGTPSWNLTVACAGTYGHQPLISEVLAESTLPTSRKPRPSPPLRSSGLDLARFLAHPEPPVYKWHMPRSCPVKQLQPHPAREKRCEKKRDEG